MDDNVDPASTMLVVDALIKANKDFELVVFPGVRHTMGESYGEHKRYDFFVRHLLNVDPPKWQELSCNRTGFHLVPVSCILQPFSDNKLHCVTTYFLIRVSRFTTPSRI